MSKDNFEDKYNDYDEDISVSDYDAYDLEESVRMSRKARREAREKRKVKKASGNKEQAKRIDNKSEQKQPHTGKKAKKAKAKPEPVVVQQFAVEEDVVAEQTPVKNGRRDKNKKKKQKSLTAKFFSILFAIVGIYACVIAGCIIYTYLNLDPDSGEPLPNPSDIISSVNKEITDIATGNIPERTTMLLLVTDEDKTRTDTIVMANYDNINSRLSLVSVPRDTVVSVSAATFEIMRSEFPEPGRNTMKINEVHHFGGENHGVELLKVELERIYGFKPDFYAKLDFEAFNYLIDSIGGIEFNVPMNMKYDDPTQNLHINLSAGLQVLDGKNAQHLVRFRQDNYGGGYPGGDLQRIGVQQEFMKAFIKKAISADTIMRNPTAYITAFFKYVDTDINVTDAVKYLKVAKSFDINNLVTYTLPGEPAYVAGRSGYAVYEEEAEELLYNVFEKPLNEITAELAEQAELEAMSRSTGTIMVLNGGYRNGRAGEIKEVLEAENYVVNEIGSYDGAKENGHRIYVSQEGVGEDLKTILGNSQIIVDSTVTASYGYDIVIVIGIEEE